MPLGSLALDLLPNVFELFSQMALKVGLPKRKPFALLQDMGYQAPPKTLEKVIFIGLKVDFDTALNYAQFLAHLLLAPLFK